MHEKLSEYIDSNVVMNLVLFQQAMEHICRIARSIALPSGNAMLLGVGGCGYQPVVHLASFIFGYNVFYTAVSSTYGVTVLKENILQLCTRQERKGSQ